MPDNKSISQLTTAEQTTSSDLFETSIPNGSLGYLSRKVSLDAIANFIANNLNYSDLQTVAKTLIGSINEAASGGGGGASIEEMTQAQYNALTPEQKADGTLRAISDATTSIGDIDDVNISSVANGDALIYDSTTGKWVNNNLNDFIVTERIQTNSVTIEAGASGSARATFVKNGYRALGIVGFQSFSTSLAIAEFSCGTNTAVVYLKNTGSAQISGSGTITILFVKNFEGE